MEDFLGTEELPESLGTLCPPAWVGIVAIFPELVVVVLVFSFFLLLFLLLLSFFASYYFLL